VRLEGIGETPGEIIFDIMKERVRSGKQEGMMKM